MSTRRRRVGDSESGVKTTPKVGGAMTSKGEHALNRLIGFPWVVEGDMVGHITSETDDRVSSRETQADGGGRERRGGESGTTHRAGSVDEETRRSRWPYPIHLVHLIAGQHPVSAKGEFIRRSVNVEIAAGTRSKRPRDEATRTR